MQNAYESARRWTDGQTDRCYQMYYFPALRTIIIFVFYNISVKDLIPIGWNFKLFQNQCKLLLKEAGDSGNIASVSWRKKN